MTISKIVGLGTWFGFFGMLLLGCVKPTVPPPTATVSPSPTDTPTPFVWTTLTPIDFTTVGTPWYPPTPIMPSPSDWVQHQVGIFRFRVPAHWQQVEEGTFAGEDGFFSVKKTDLRDAEWMLASCIALANDGQRDRFGDEPKISQDWLFRNSVITKRGDFESCSVTPGKDDPNTQVAILLREWDHEAIWEMSGDLGNFIAVFRSVRPTVPTPSPTPKRSICPKNTVSFPSVTTTTIGSLSITESPVGRGDCGRTISASSMRDTVKKFSLTTRGVPLDEVNRIISPYHYQIAADPEGKNAPCTYQLMVNGSVSLSDICSVTRIVQTPGKFQAKMTTFDGRIVWLSEMGWYSPDGYAFNEGENFPIFSERGEYRYLFVRDIAYPVGASARVEIWLNNQPIYQLAIPMYTPTRGPIHNFDTWHGDWFLQMEGVVFRNGKNWNEEMGYDFVSGWHIVAGEPMYFWQRDGEWGLAYHGYPDIVLPMRYDKIWYAVNCCEPAGLNPVIGESGAGFYALRDGIWWWVMVEQVPLPAESTPPTVIP